MTAAPKPVPGQIVVTDHELSALQSSLGNGKSARDAIAALNEVRCGPPPGQVRMSPHGDIAVRIQTDKGLEWRLIHDGDNPDSALNSQAGDGDVRSWNVIGQESWRYRVLDKDFQEDE